MNGQKEPITWCIIKEKMFNMPRAHQVTKCA